MSGGTIQTGIADFVASAPEGWAVAACGSRIRLAFLDTLAVSVAGAHDSASVKALAYARATGGIRLPPLTWILPEALPPEPAALLAATLAHALDYDDIAPSWRGHPSAVMLPALTTFAAISGATIDELVAAYAIGFEVGARVGGAVAGRHYEAGWHATATIGTLAATAACCRLARLDRKAVSHALGLAVAQAGGVQANFGTEARALQAGFAASAAVRSCLLAAHGIGASASAIDGPRGFADLAAGGSLDAGRFANLGKEPCALETTGIDVKLYPAYYGVHRAIEAALALRGDEAIDPEGVAGIEIEGTPGAHTPLLKRLPQTPQEARLSAEYVVACALVDGSVGLDCFAAPPDSRPAIAQLMSRSRVAERPVADPARGATVRVRYRNGRVREAKVATLRANRDGGPATEQLLAKAADCLASAGAGGDAQAIYDAIVAGGRRAVIHLFSDPPFDRIARRLWPEQGVSRDGPGRGRAGFT